MVHQLPEHRDNESREFSSTVKKTSSFARMQKPIRAMILSLFTTGAVSSTVACTPQLNLSGVSAEELPSGVNGALPTPELVRAHPVSKMLDNFSEEDWRAIDIQNEQEKELLRTALRYSMIMINGKPRLTVGTLLLKDSWNVAIETDGNAFYAEEVKQSAAKKALTSLSSGTGIPIRFSTIEEADLVISIHQSSGNERASTVAGYAPSEGRHLGLSDVYFYRPNDGNIVHVLSDRLYSPSLFPEEHNFLCASDQCQDLKEQLYRLSTWQTTIHEASHLLSVINTHLPDEMNVLSHSSYMASGLSTTITNHPETFTKPYASHFTDGQQHIFANHAYAPERDITYSLMRLGRLYMKRMHPTFRVPE